MAKTKRKVTKRGRSSPSEGVRARWLVVLALLVIICVAEGIRIRLLDMPLERDEGEYAYAGQLMLQGIPPYKLAYNMKLPGTYAAYAVIIAVFGQTIRGIHLGLVVVNAATILLIYSLGRTLFGRVCGLVAAATFAVLSLSPSVLGLAAHATHFVTLFGLAGLLALLRSDKTDRVIWFFVSGLLFGVAFVMKQPGVFLGIFGGLFVIWHEWHRRPRDVTASGKRIVTFCVGAVLPFAITCIILAAAGVFDAFRFWTFSYAREYVSAPSLWQGWLGFKQTAIGLWKAAPGIWLLIPVATVAGLLSKSHRTSTLVSLLIFIACLATVVPGFYFREHYFITVLPAVGLLLGAGMQTLCDRIGEQRRSSLWIGAAAAVFIAACTQVIVQRSALFFTLSPTEASREVYKSNPFPESVEIGNYIREHSNSDARIAVIGSEPQIYFYSQRHSATGFIYMYPLMEEQKYASNMQEQMIQEVEQAKPDFVVFVSVKVSWLRQEKSDMHIVEWAEKYIGTSFDQVGLADIQGKGQTVYRWGDKAVAAIPRAQNFVWIFKRRELF